MNAIKEIKIFYLIKVLILTGGVALYVSPAFSQSLTYTPINPSFGGSSFNSSHLLGIANAQNKFKDPDVIARQGTTSTDLFIRQLQSRLLSGLAAQVTDAIFGDSPQESGRIVFGDQTITFSRGLENVHLVIEDNDTGARTEIEIPIFTTDTGTESISSLQILPASTTSSPVDNILDPLNFDQSVATNSNPTN